VCVLAISDRCQKTVSPPIGTTTTYQLFSLEKRR
jgi:hypothetical protein